MKIAKKTIFIVTLLFTLIDYSYSQNLYLRDFEEVIGQEESVSNQVHILERCAGLFSAVGARFIGSGRADAKDIGEKLVATGAEFMVSAVTVAQTEKLNYSPQHAMNESMAIAKIYGAIMDDNHRRTGNAIEGQVVADQKICTFLAKN